MSYGSNHVLTSTQVGRTDDSNVGHKKSRQLPCVINATASHRKNVVFAAHHRKHERSVWYCIDPLLNMPVTPLFCSGDVMVRDGWAALVKSSPSVIQFPPPHSHNQGNWRSTWSASKPSIFKWARRAGRREALSWPSVPSLEYEGMGEDENPISFAITLYRTKKH